MGENKYLSRLEALPDELLRDIVSRVATSSCSDVHHIMLTSTELATNAQDSQICKSVNLSAFTSHPLWAYNNFQKHMEKCLASGNVEAHYVKGIQEYFLNNNTIVGLEHLKQSADGSYQDGVYLYGILTLCRGQTEEGKAYLDKLQWAKHMVRGDQCWRNVRGSLRGLPVIRKSRYITALTNMRPPRECKLNDMNTRCSKCYYYEQMRKFINIITL